MSNTRKKLVLVLVMLMSLMINALANESNGAAAEVLDGATFNVADFVRPEDIPISILTLCLIMITGYYARETKKQADYVGRQVNVMETQAYTMENQYEIMRNGLEQEKIEFRRDAIRRKQEKLIKENKDLIIIIHAKLDDRYVWDVPSYDFRTKYKHQYSEIYMPFWNKIYENLHLNSDLGRQILEYKGIQRNFLDTPSYERYEVQQELDRSKKELISAVNSRYIELRNEIEKCEDELYKLESGG